MSTSVRLALALAACAGAGTALAGDVVHVSGKSIDKVIQMDPAYGTPGPGRFAYRATARGMVQAGGDPMFDGSERTVRAQWEVNAAVGVGSGFATTAKGGDSVVSQWNGMCSTVLGAQGKPSTYCAGGWTIVPGTGTGRYATLAGGGSWSGTVLPDGGFEGTFEGQYTK